MRFLPRAAHRSSVPCLAGEITANAILLPSFFARPRTPAAEVGNWEIIAMTAMVGAGYLVVAVIRFNILYAEPILPISLQRVLVDFAVLHDDPQVVELADHADVVQRVSIH